MEIINVVFCTDNLVYVMQGEQAEYEKYGVLLQTGTLLEKKSFSKPTTKIYKNFVEKMKRKYDTSMVSECLGSLEDNGVFLY